MNNENMMEMNEVVETGTEIVTTVAKNNDLLKKIGVGAGFAIAGALVYEGGKRLVGLVKSKIDAKKNGVVETEASDVESEIIED